MSSFNGPTRLSERSKALDAAVDRVESALSSQPQAVARLLLVVFSGLPGSGKSYLARQLQTPLGAALIETDLIRHTLFAPPLYSAKESSWVYAVSHALIQRHLRLLHPVVFDGTNLVERNRRTLYRIADDAQARLVIVNTVAPIEVIHQRLQARQVNRHPDDHSDADVAVFDKLRRTEQPIKRPHLVIDTTQDGDVAVQRILGECQA